MNFMLFWLILVPATPLSTADIIFQDGSIIKMQVKEKALIMQTKYGKLAIPLTDIRRIEFGKIDIVQASDGPVMGTLLAPTILAHSPYFGDIALKRADLRAIQFRFNSNIEVEKVIDAKDPWVDTGLFVVQGDRFTIMAIGVLDLWPQNPGTYITSARGYPEAKGKNSQYPACALLGKIGDEVFVIGERYEGEMPSSGNLLLSIAPAPWENSAQGNYRITIKGKP